MIEVHLYGKLRRFFNSEPVSKNRHVIMLDPEPDLTIGVILEHVGIPLDEVYHLFYNRKILSTHCSMAETLGYRQENDNPNEWDMDFRVNDGDRIGLFGKDMSALVV